MDNILLNRYDGKNDNWQHFYSDLTSTAIGRLKKPHRYFNPPSIGGNGEAEGVIHVISDL